MLFDITPYIDIKAAAPFFQYQGGKARLAEWITSFFPSSIEDYYEPFVGGGGVFWHVRKNEMAKSYTISDLSKIVCCHYKTLRDNYKDFMDLVNELSAKHSYTFFYEAKARLKELKNQNIFTVETSALDVYNKRTSMMSGGYTPLKYGKEKFLVNSDLFFSCHKLLQGVEIVNADYYSVVKARENSVVYCDPPYSGTRQDFYEVDSWDKDDDTNLVLAIQNWVECGAMVVLSSMAGTKPSPFVLEGFRVYEKEYRHSLGTVPQAQREKVREVIFVKG